MTGPLIDELAGLETDAARAAWLLRYPLGHLPANHLRLKAVLSGCQFMAGANYVDAELAAVLAVRTAEGDVPPEKMLGVHFWRSTMREVARGRKG
jgi:hypothetical protein